MTSFLMTTSRLIKKEFATIIQQKPGKNVFHYTGNYMHLLHNPKIRAELKNHGYKVEYVDEEASSSKPDSIPIAYRSKYFLINIIN